MFQASASSARSSRGESEIWGDPPFELEHDADRSTELLDALEAVQCVAEGNIVQLRESEIWESASDDAGGVSSSSGTSGSSTADLKDSHSDEFDQLPANGLWGQIRS